MRPRNASAKDIGQYRPNARRGGMSAGAVSRSVTRKSPLAFSPSVTQPLVAGLPDGEIRNVMGSSAFGSRARQDSNRQVLRPALAVRSNFRVRRSGCPTLNYTELLRTQVRLEALGV